jgi:hypothetical protein
MTFTISQENQVNLNGSSGYSPDMDGQYDSRVSFAGSYLGNAEHDGHENSSSNMDGEYGTFQKIYDMDVYDGETEVTPSDVEQILRTANKAMLENVTVNPVPDSYRDYEILRNKPQISSVELIGNKSLSDLGIETISNMELEILLR